MFLEMILIPAMGLGLSAMSIPGPLQAYLLNVTLRYGWRRGLLVVLAPILADGPIIFLTVVILDQMPAVAIQVIRVIGGLLLLYIAWGAWKQLRAGASLSAGDEEQLKANISPLRVLGTATAMNFFSPGPYLFWATVNGPLLLQAVEMGGFVGGAAMMLAFYGVFLGGLCLWVLLFSRLGAVDERVTRIILIITIALLLWFGTSLIAEAASLVRLHNWLTLAAVVIAGIYFIYQRLLKPQPDTR